MSKRLQRALPIALVGAVIGVLAVAGGRIALRETAPEPGPRTVAVFADRALQTVLDDIVQAFQRRSDVRVEVRYGVPGDLFAGTGDGVGGPDLYIAQGAGDLESLGGTAGEKDTIAWVLPVILVRDGNPEGIESAADLARPGLAVGVADPEGSELGRMTPGILAHLGVDRDAVAANTVFTSTQDPELGNAVRMGRVDAALVWEPMAQGTLRTGIVQLVPDEAIAAAIMVARAASTRDTAAADEFVAFLRGRAAQNLFEQYAFTILPPQ